MRVDPSQKTGDPHRIGKGYHKKGGRRGLGEGARISSSPQEQLQVLAVRRERKRERTREEKGERRKENEVWGDYRLAWGFSLSFSCGERCTPTPRREEEKVKEGK
eukprot:Sspe_Gene.91909::Locus_63561_Transcript_1_1_Confidence_1.000_Length_493::g.91909::m.91909